MMSRGRLRLYLRVQLFIWGLLCINGQALSADALSSYPLTNATKENVIVAFIFTTEEDLSNSTDCSTMSTTMIHPEVCAANLAVGINVINRTSLMFEALITYNCSSVEPSELSIFLNDTEVDYCSFTNELSNDTITVLCEKISKHAGRNWTFTIGSNNVSNQLILHETFIITLAPLSLQTATNLSITADADLTSALVYIPNCAQITDLEYLRVRCDNTSDLSNNTLSDDCEYTCSNLIPGSMYEASLIRLKIPIADKRDNDTESTFAEETLTEIYRIDLDTVTNLTYIIENDTVTFSFAPIRGNFDDVNITCFAQEQRCSSAPTNFTNSIGNCSTCTSISISPIERGVRYQCQASTIKEDFDDVLSDELPLSTPLEPVFLEQARLVVSTSSQFVIDVVPRSDFEYMQSICIRDVDLAFPCSDFHVNHSDCSTKLIHKGHRGCSYHCAILTRKSTFPTPSSSNYIVHLVPPTPVIYSGQSTSRSVSFRWNITDELVYVQYYEIYRDGTLVANKDKNVQFHMEGSLFPNRNYTFQVRMISNQKMESKSVTFLTLEEAPQTPSDVDIATKIIWNSDDPSSTESQHVMEFHPSLFSDDYGPIRNYSIYVRQDQSKGGATPDADGTYAVAWTNSSVDYLAIFLSKSFLTVTKSNSKLRLVIGNGTSCPNNASSLIPCNGKLKPHSNYSVIVRVCNMAGCTAIRSRKFQTKMMEKPSKKLPVWAIVLGIAVPSLCVVLLIWQRKKIVRLFREDASIPVKRTGSSMSLVPIYNAARPKALVQYLDMREEEERMIADEYQELEKCQPPCQRAEEDLCFRKYDRYQSIFARGPWRATAVYLTGLHRSHDYINANFIRGYDYPRQYIACQGPMGNTYEDFWDMISQHRVSKIIMLTEIAQASEQHRPECKSDCYPYFPWREGDTLHLHRLSVRTLRVEEYPEVHLQIRHISLRERGCERRIVHYYYNHWEDFRAVTSEKLLDLIGTINKDPPSKTRKNPPAPVVVHCRAGVGRTGTYIAVETLLRRLGDPRNNLASMKLDVMGLVYQLRQDRMRMVQTQEQYMLVNLCVEAYLRRTHQLHKVVKPPVYLSNVGRRYVNHPSTHRNIIHPSSLTSVNHYINEFDPPYSSSPTPPSDAAHSHHERFQRDSRRPADASLLDGHVLQTSRRNSRSGAHRQRSRSSGTRVHI